MNRLFSKKLSRGEKIALGVSTAAAALWVASTITHAISEHLRTRPPALVNECTSYTTSVFPVTRFDADGKPYTTTQTRRTCNATRVVCRPGGPDYSGPVSCDGLWDDHNSRGNAPRI